MKLRIKYVGWAGTILKKKLVSLRSQKIIMNETSQQKFIYYINFRFKVITTRRGLIIEILRFLADARLIVTCTFDFCFRTLTSVFEQWTLTVA